MASTSLVYLVPDAEQHDGDPSVGFSTLEVAKKHVYQARELNAAKDSAHLVLTTDITTFVNCLRTTHIPCALGTLPHDIDSETALLLQAHLWHQIREICYFDSVSLFVDGDIRDPLLFSVLDAAELVHEETRDQLLVYTRALYAILPEEFAKNVEFPIDDDERMPTRNYVSGPEAYARQLATRQPDVYMLDDHTCARFDDATRIQNEWIQAHAFLELNMVLQQLQVELTPKGKRKTPVLFSTFSDSGAKISWGQCFAEIVESALQPGVPEEVSQQVLCACTALAQQLRVTETQSWRVASHTAALRLLGTAPGTALSRSGTLLDAAADDSGCEDISLGSECDGEDSDSEFADNEWDPAVDDDAESIGLGFGGDGEESCDDDDESDYESDEDEASETDTDEPVKQRRKPTLHRPAPAKQRRIRPLSDSEDEPGQLVIMDPPFMDEVHAESATSFLQRVESPRGSDVDLAVFDEMHARVVPDCATGGSDNESL